MKPYFISTFCVFSLLTISFTKAQDTLKATKSSIVTELNINPFQGSISLNNSINQIKLRFFTEQSIALRLAFGINNASQSESRHLAYGNNPVDDKTTAEYTILSASFGVEKHFAGTRRLSPYIGVELAFASKNSESEINSLNSDKKIKGAWTATSYIQTNGFNGIYYSTVTSYNERGFFSFGLNGVTGFDYYVSKHLFVGYEMLITINKKWFQKIEITETIKGNNSSQASTYPDNESDSFSFGPGIINGIRLGYIF